MYRPKFTTMTAIAAAAAAAAAMSAGPAAASTAAPAAPAILAGPFASPWASGYAAVTMTGGASAFTRILDTYTIPTLNCAKTPNAVAEFRTGMDGITDGTIERVGVSASCSDGAPNGDTAWYQMIPADPKPVPMFSPRAGDVIHASITVPTPGTYELSLADLTRPALKFTVTQKCATCQSSSAEVTAGPQGPGVPWYPPADFGAVHFNGIVVTDSAGVSGGLANPDWSTDRLAQPTTPAPYTAAGLLSSAGPPLHSLFADVWK
jgi:hypothetical protein